MEEKKAGEQITRSNRSKSETATSNVSTSSEKFIPVKLHSRQPSLKVEGTPRKTTVGFSLKENNGVAVGVAVGVVSPNLSVASVSVDTQNNMNNVNVSSSPFGNVSSAGVSSHLNPIVSSSGTDITASASTRTISTSYNNVPNDEESLAKPIDIVSVSGLSQITSLSTSITSRRPQQQQQQQQQQQFNMSGSTDAIFTTASLGPIAPVDMADLAFADGFSGSKKPRERRHTAEKFQQQHNRGNSSGSAINATNTSLGGNNVKQARNSVDFTTGTVLSSSVSGGPGISSNATATSISGSGTTGNANNSGAVSGVGVSGGGGGGGVAGAGNNPTSGNRRQVPNTILFDDAKARSKAAKQQQVHRTLTQKQVALFSHLPQYERENSYSLNIKNKESIHPLIIELGLLFAEMKIVGANARCVAFLNAMKQVVMDYQMPPNEVFNRHFGHHISPMINFLVQIRPMAVSMGNAIRFLKNVAATVPADFSEDQCKEQVFDAIENYMRDRIHLADKLIIDYGVRKISDNDNILIFSRSSVVINLIKEAHKMGKRFRVFLADSRPLFEGRQTLQILSKAGVDCTYVHLSSVGNIIGQMSKIFLGAHSIFSNGTAMSRVGTALVAMLGHQYNVPVIFCCKTYKFSERVQLDSIVYNEIGDPDDLVKLNSPSPGLSGESVLADWRDIASLKLLNIMYDVTPARFISMVITEIGMIPCTSVPVVLREYGPITSY